MEMNMKFFEQETNNWHRLFTLPLDRLIFKSQISSYVDNLHKRNAHVQSHKVDKKLVPAILY